MSFIQIYSKESKPNNEVYMMPWESDATCYNFNEPGVFIPDDSIDEMIRDPMHCGIYTVCFIICAGLIYG